MTLLSAGTKKSVCGEEEIICIANNSLEVCLIGLAPSENAIARKFATVWVDAKKKNSQQKLNELAARLLFDGDLWTN